MTDKTISSTSNVCYENNLVDGHIIDPQTALDVGRFRKARRQSLYQMRKSINLDQRRKMANDIARQLDQFLGRKKDKPIAVYWPIRGELDLRDWMASAHQEGAHILLPTMPAKNQPLQFSRWTPETEMHMGLFNIPVPKKPEPITPEWLVVPLVGVDSQNHRLGNGGGYYDRTLARLPGAVPIGIGADFCKIDTIFPQPWDMPMREVFLAAAD